MVVSLSGTLQNVDLFPFIKVAEIDSYLCVRMSVVRLSYPTLLVIKILPPVSDNKVEMGYCVMNARHLFAFALQTDEEIAVIYYGKVSEAAHTSGHNYNVQVLMIDKLHLFIWH
jgi:hypothetical protein